MTGVEIGVLTTLGVLVSGAAVLMLAELVKDQRDTVPPSDAQMDAEFAPTLTRTQQWEQSRSRGLPVNGAYRSQLAAVGTAPVERVGAHATDDEAIDTGHIPAHAADNGDTDRLVKPDWPELVANLRAWMADPDATGFVPPVRDVEGVSR